MSGLKFTFLVRLNIVSTEQSFRTLKILYSGLYCMQAQIEHQINIIFLE